MRFRGGNVSSRVQFLGSSNTHLHDTRRKPGRSPRNGRYNWDRWCNVKCHARLRRRCQLRRRPELRRNHQRWRAHQLRRQRGSRRCHRIVPSRRRVRSSRRRASGGCTARRGGRKRRHHCNRWVRANRRHHRCGRRNRTVPSGCWARRTCGSRQCRWQLREPLAAPMRRPAVPQHADSRSAQSSARLRLLAADDVGARSGLSLSASRGLPGPPEARELQRGSGYVLHDSLRFDGLHAVLFDTGRSAVLRLGGWGQRRLGKLHFGS